MARRRSETLVRRLRVLEERIAEKDNQPLLIISGYDEAGVPIVLSVLGADFGLSGDEARAWGEAHRDQWGTERAKAETV